MKYIFAIMALLFVAPACAQQTQTFSKYMQGLPSATTPLSGAEPMIVMQSGVAKQTPTSSIAVSPGPVIIAANSPYNVSSSASDNSAGIVAAIAAVNSAGGGTVILPAGTLKACSQMQWAGNGISITGAGEGTSPYSPVSTGGTVIQACSSFTGTNQVLVGANSSSVLDHQINISNLSFDGNASASVGLLLRDVTEGVYSNINFYHHTGTGIELNGTSGNTVGVTSRNIFSNIHLKERNNPGGMTTNGITCMATTQNTWFSIFIEHANGDGIVVGENCDQQTWTTLFIFRANTETGYAIATSGDAASVIGNWALDGVLTSGQWNMACCSPANVAWTMSGLNNANFNTGVTESNFLTGSGAAGVAYLDMTGNWVNSGVRNKLRANASYFVNTAGSDSNDCLTLATACLTIQHTVNVIELLDFNGFTVTVNIGSSSGSQTFTETVTISGLTGAGNLVFIGANATPTNTVWTSTTDSTLKASHGGNTQIHVGNLEISNNSVGNGAVDCEYQSNIVVDNNLVFGATTNADLYSHDNQCVILEDNASVTIAGNASFHLFTKGGYIFQEGSTITINGGVTVTTFAQASKGGVIQATGSTFTNNGTVTNKFFVNSGAAIDTLGNGLNYFPGTFAGIFSGGGTYLDEISSQTGVAVFNGNSNPTYVSGVSCSAGTVSTATLTIISGVVTHC